MDNGLKYTDEGHINVSASEQDGFVVISVSDTGIGIAEKDLDRIFESFEQGDSSLIKENRGVGLGLALTKKLVELQGGRIQVESKPGLGSIFRVSFPATVKTCSETDPAVVQTPIDPVRTMQAFSAEPTNPEGFSLILAVDDDPINQQVIANYLDGKSYTVQRVSSGIQALDYIRTERKPELVLLDVMMPAHVRFRSLPQDPGNVFLLRIADSFSIRPQPDHRHHRRIFIRGQ